MDKRYKFEKLVEIMSVLRGPDGCPWDRDQTHKSIAPHLIEESYEVLDAIEREDFEHLKEELGDLLLQVVFHAQMASEKGRFDINDVIDGIVEKLERRHPHVFADEIASTSKEVLRNWERIKKEEKKKSLHLPEVSSAFPALIYASKLQARASRMGFDWRGIEDVVEKFDEEIEELRDAYCKRGNVEEEIGDTLFTVVNMARHLGVDSEVALKKAINKFRERFEFMEEEAEKRGLCFENLSLEEKDKLWEEAKQLMADG